VCLGAAYAQAYYKFFLTGTTTPANVYERGFPASPFSPTGVVTADNYGRFPPIYLDGTVTYKVQLYNSSNTLIRQVDPYVQPLATTGVNNGNPFGIDIDAYGEITIPAPSSGGAGTSLTLVAGSLGSSPLLISSPVPGSSALIINSSATTGAYTATFTATNKPGTATSSPAGWLPITCDGVQYYTPIWHGNNFEYYSSANYGVVSQSISSNLGSVIFKANGVLTQGAGTFSPIGDWASPVPPVSGFYISITKTGGLPGLSFSAAQGSWTLLGVTDLTIGSNGSGVLTGTYAISPLNTGVPVVGAGTITLFGGTGVQSATFDVVPNLSFNSNGSVTFPVGVETNGVGWYSPTTSNIGSSYWINISLVEGSPGCSFSVAQGAWTNIGSGLSVGISGGGIGSYVTGYYEISPNSSGTSVIGSGIITLNATGVQSPAYNSGQATGVLFLAGNGTATLGGTATSSWYSPTTPEVGAGYYIQLTRNSNNNGATPGVNFSVAQGVWTPITAAGLSIGLVGGLGSAFVNGTYQISNSPTGATILGSGTISIAR
jgi:hypothetical protein